MKSNPERGEVELVINGVKGVICAEMANLAMLSKELGTKSLRELFERLQGVEPYTMYAVIDALLVNGDAKALKTAIRTPMDLAIVSAAAVKSLGAFTSEPAKNG